MRQKNTKTTWLYGRKNKREIENKTKSIETRHNYNGRWQNRKLNGKIEILKYDLQFIRWPNRKLNVKIEILKKITCNLNKKGK